MVAASSSSLPAAAPPVGSGTNGSSGSGSRGLARMQACVHSLLGSIQEDPSRQGLLDTPKRVAKAMMDMTDGYRADPAALLSKALFDEPDIEEGAGGLVLVRDIDFASLSQDTLLPFYGRCHIAYVPSNGVVLGLSKLARLTKLCAKQLHTQPSLARLLLHLLHKQLQPQGALVVIEARHLDYTAQQPPQLQVSAAASGSLAAAAAATQQHGSGSSAAATTAALASSSSVGATLEEVLELLGVPLQPQEVQLLPDAANPLCLLHPGCSCHTKSSPAAAAAVAAAPFASTSSSSSGLSSPLAGLLLSTAAAACSTCGSTRLAPHVLRGMSASAAGGMDSPRAPATPDPSENNSENNSDTDGSEQGSDVYCCPSLLAGSAADIALPAQLLLEAAAAMQPAAAVAAAAAGAGEQAAAGQQQWAGSVSMEAALLQLLAEAGIDATSAAVQAAARRHVLALLAATSGYRQEQPSRPVLLSQHGSQQQQQQQDVQQEQQDVQQQYRQYEHHVSFMSQCEHHMLPFHGTLHIQYLLPASSCSSSDSSSSSCSDSSCSDSRRRSCQQQQQQQQQLSDAEAQQLVRCYTKRLQVQERITQQVAAAVQRLLQPAGVMVVVQAVHMCMVARGVENHAGSTSTRAALGAYERDPQLRCQFLKGLRQQEQQEQVQQQGRSCSCGC